MQFLCNKMFIFYFFVYISVISARQLNIVGLNESWICNIKKSCFDCLLLVQCSWCTSDNTCFSEELPQYEGYCEVDRRHNNYGMSLHENANCGCDEAIRSDITNCQHPADASVCSNRGTCECGRCICNELPDPENPSKTILGEYCEYDNFSCNDTKCNEGPYNIYELQDFLENGD